MHEAAFSLYVVFVYLLLLLLVKFVHSAVLWCGGGVDHSTCACTLTLLDVVLQMFLCTLVTSNNIQYYMDQQSNALQEHQPFQVVLIKSSHILQDQELPTRETVPL